MSQSAEYLTQHVKHELTVLSSCGWEPPSGYWIGRNVHSSVAGDTFAAGTSRGGAGEALPGIAYLGTLFGNERTVTRHTVPFLTLPRPWGEVRFSLSLQSYEIPGSDYSGTDYTKEKYYAVI